MSEQMREALGHLTKQELLELAKMSAVIEQRVVSGAPLNDDELHLWIKSELGVDIPRESVCEGHQAPFQFVADFFFERENSGIVVANRGGSKTYGVAILHYINGKFKAGIEGFTFGATEAQSKRAYAHLKDLIRKKGDDEIESSLESMTKWKNGSSVEIVPGTIRAVNGPHPQIVHADEVELMDEDVFYESRNMAQSKTVDGSLLRAQNIITSTRKRASGLMQRLVDEVMDAELQGKEPPYKLYTWCIFETAKNVPNCQKANPDLPAGKRCPCDQVKRGKLEGGVDRTLADVCNGRLARSQGWIAFDDVVSLFSSNTPEMWEAQQECRKPSTSGMVVPTFGRERHCIKDFDMDPANGPIYEGIDFGGTNPHAVLFLQILDHEVEVQTWSGGTRRLPQGCHVYFDEIYKAEISNNKLASVICQREALWRKSAPGFRVNARFCDPQGKAARLDLRNHNPALPSVWYATRDVREHIKLVNELFSDYMIVIDASRCLMMVEEIEAWHYPRSRSSLVDDPEIPVNDFDHAMAAMRYSIANVARLAGRSSAVMAPISGSSGHTTASFLRDVQKSISTGGYRNSSSTSKLPRSERWRATFGSDRLEQ